MPAVPPLSRPAGTNPGVHHAHIVIHLSGEPDADLTRRTVDTVAEFTQNLLGKKPKLRPDLHEVSYIHVIDARGAAYGYGGRTQEYRHQQAGV